MKSSSGSNCESSTEHVSDADVREEFARIVRARPTDRVLFASELAEAVALVVGAAPGEVVTLDLGAEFADTGVGNRVVPAQIDLTTTLAVVDGELERRPAALLVVPAVAEATGEVLPLPALAAIAHRRGARLLVDASELVTRRAVNLSSHGIDYLVLSDPDVTGPAVLVGRADWLAGCPDTPWPETPGSGTASTDTTRTDGTGPTFDVAGLPGRRLVCDLGYEWAGVHEQALAEWLDAHIDRLPGIRRLQLWPDAHDRVGIASLAVAGRAEPVTVRWGPDTGVDELARQLNSLAENVLEQEKS